MAQTGKKWYVLRVISGKETKVKEYMEAAIKRDQLLSSHVGQILLPTEKYFSTQNGKRKIKERFFLPGYLLVEAELIGEVAHTLRFMPNVLGFLGGLDNPTPVKQSEVDRILGITQGPDDNGGAVSIPFHEGDTVKVAEGPFTGFSGVIEDVNSEKFKLKVMVKIFGRKTPLELSFTQVEKE